MELIINEQNENRGEIFPRIIPYTVPDLSELFLHAKNSAKYTFLFLQEPSDSVGPEITLDLHRVKELSVRYAFNNNTDLANLLKTSNKYPSLFAVDRGSKVQKIETEDSTRESFRIAVRLFLEPRHIKVPESEIKNIYRGKWIDAEVPDMASFMQERERKALKEKVKKMGDVIFQMDLETVLR